MKVKMAVIGVGHLGKNHARLAGNLPDAELAAVVDANESVAREIGQQYQVPYYTDYRAVADKVQAVSIVTPTVSHYAIAADCIRRGVHTFVEKPITQTVAQGRKLVDLARKHQVVLQVGHVERFNPALTAVRGDISQPRFMEGHRLAPLSFRSLDIDVVRDLMIHDIDIVLALVGALPKKISANGVAVFSEAVDIANARLIFPDGAVANLTASRVSDKSMRKMRVFSRDAYVSIDFYNRTAQVYRKSPDAPPPEKLLKNIDVGAIKDYQSLMREKFLQIKEPVIPKVDQLAEELADFIKAIQNRTNPEVSGADGLNALIVAEQVMKQIRLAHCKQIAITKL